MRATAPVALALFGGFFGALGCGNSGNINVDDTAGSSGATSGATGAAASTGAASTGSGATGSSTASATAVGTTASGATTSGTATHGATTAAGTTSGTHTTAAAGTSSGTHTAASSSGTTGTHTATSSSGSSTTSSGGTTSGVTGAPYKLGMNFPGLSYYNDAAIYADMTYAMAGNDGPWDTTPTDGAAPLDSTGAPTVAAWAGVTGAYPSGAYTVTWDGTGSFTFAGQTLSTPTVTMSGGVQHNTATLTWTQQLSPASGATWVYITATPPVTNIHILAPAAMVSSDGIFLNDLLQRLKPFANDRFMDALNTNGNLIQNWSQRTRPSAGSRTNTPQGMAYEDIIALANQTGADIWINVPALATDDYVCRLARLFHYGEQGDSDTSTPCDPTAPAGTATTTPLNGSSTLYVEYSNEIWNWGFQQIEDVYCMVWGMPDKTGDGKHCDVTAPTSAIGAAALADTSLPWDSTNTYGKASQFVMILEKRQSDIFRTVWGCTSGSGCQVQIPMNVQAAYAAEADEGFQFLKAAYGNVGAIDWMAVAPYFSTDADSNNDSVNDIFTDLDNNILASNPPSTEGSAIVNWLKGDLAEAALYGLPVIAYEGGQGLTSSDYAANTISAQADPRMYTATQTYFGLWDTLVGRDHLFNYYSFVGTYGSYGCWGALVNQDDPGSQKWDALLSLTRTPGDANLDGVVNAADCTILKANYNSSTNVWWMQGDFNHDGKVDASDLALMNANITGAQCVAP